jgi:hypothetical protein
MAVRSRYVRVNLHSPTWEASSGRLLATGKRCIKIRGLRGPNLPGPTGPEQTGADGAGTDRSRRDGNGVQLGERTVYAAAPSSEAASSATSVGVRPTRTPLPSSASALALAVPREPDTIAPACPMVLPGGAVKPAM